jgi:cation:H+ antiporter
MNLFFWILVLLASVWAAHWGSDKLAEPLKKLRQQWGLSEAAGAAFVALATASPEVGTNTVSAIRGLSDIGLGNLLGSNIISVPAIVSVAYLASRKQSRAKGDRQLMRVRPEALTVQALPYLAIIALAALLTLPKPWRGLQPLDGWIMLAAYIAYAAQAVFRERQEGEKVQWRKKEIFLAVLGALALAAGAYFVVIATDNLVSALGISRLIGGLFITSTLSIAPEVFATWSVARSGQVTTATTNVIADNSVTMTLAFFPLALVTMPIDDLQLYSVNLAFVAILGAVYAGLLYFHSDSLGSKKYSFRPWEVLILIGIYAAYLAIMLFGVLNVF